MTQDHCTCEHGRDTDGSEFGPCAYCEEQAWRDEHGMHDDDLEAMIIDREPPVDPKQAVREMLERSLAASPIKAGE